LLLVLQDGLLPGLGVGMTMDQVAHSKLCWAGLRCTQPLAALGGGGFPRKKKCDV